MTDWHQKAAVASAVAVAVAAASAGSAVVGFVSVGVLEVEHAVAQEVLGAMRGQADFDSELVEAEEHWRLVEMQLVALGLVPPLAVWSVSRSKRHLRTLQAGCLFLEVAAGSSLHSNPGVPSHPLVSA